MQKSVQNLSRFVSPTKAAPARQLLALGCDCFERDDDDFRGIDLRSRAH